MVTKKVEEPADGGGMDGGQRTRVGSSKEGKLGTHVEIRLIHSTEQK